MKAIVSNVEELVEAAEEDQEIPKEEVASLQERYNTLEKDIDEKLKKSSNVDKVMVEVSKLKAMQANVCGDIWRKLDFLEPIGDDVEKAKVQADEIEVGI